MPIRYPIGSSYEEWMRKVHAKGWGKLTQEEMSWYRTLTAQQEAVKDLEQQLSAAKREQARRAALPECEIKWCGNVSDDGVYCKRCRRNIDSWKRKSSAPTGKSGLGTMSSKVWGKGGETSSQNS